MAMLNRFQPASNFKLLNVSRYFCGGSICFISKCLNFLCLMYFFIILVKFR